MTWLLFSITAPFLISFTNFAEKFLIDKKIRNPLILSVIGGFVFLLLGIVIILFHGFVLLPPLQSSLLLLAGFLIVIYVIPYFKALSLDDPSRVIPLFQFVPVFVLILSSFFLKETLSNYQMASFLLIITGGFLLGFEKHEVRYFKLKAAFWYMMLSSFLAALVGIFYKFAVVSNDYWLSIIYLSLGSGLAGTVLLFIPSVRKSFAEEAHNLNAPIVSLIVLNKLFEIAGDMASAFAMTLAPVTLVSVIGGLQSFFVFAEGLVLSIWFPHVIKEDIRKSTLGLKLISIILIFIGVYFLSI